MPAPRISAAELTERLTHEAITIVDVRQGDPYTESSVTLPGSIRLDPNNDQDIQAWLETSNKSQPVVTFCT